MSITKTAQALDKFQSDLMKGYGTAVDSKVNSLRNLTIRELNKIATREMSGKDYIDPKDTVMLKTIQRRVLDYLKAQSITSPLKQIESQYGAVLSIQQRLFEELGYQVDSSDMQRADVLSKTTLQEIGGQSDLITSEVRQAFNGALHGRMSFNELVEKIGGHFDSTTREYEGGLLNKFKSAGYTIANTGLMTADRAVMNDTAIELGIDWFEYVGGGVIKTTRDFCKMLLSGRHPNTGRAHGKYWHRDEISDLNNGMTPDVMLTAGGHNCRHRWQPAPASVNERMGR